jgi:hypothetical protein
MTVKAQVTTLRPELETPPERIRKLPVHRGYPVPWFVEWIKDGELAPIGEGEPDFRIMSAARLRESLRVRWRCWVCGERTGAHVAFNVGPMCAINRTSNEPPSHRECAEWAARNCPFLVRPHMQRRDAGLPEDAVMDRGIAILRNPGVALVWVTRRPSTKRDPNGGVLFDLGAPESVSWWCEGRPACESEVLASIESGLPTLRELAEAQGPLAVTHLDRAIDRARLLLPA